MTAQQTSTLRVALGDYPHTLALKQGAITSDRLSLEFADIKPVFRAFAAMVREQAYDICEMAIVTYLQAKAHGKPLVLLPAVMMGRFQHNCMLYNSDRGVLTPADLPGRRVGVRSFAQTTGVWLRGILANDYGVAIDRIRWVSFEDAHVLEFRDPPGVERAPSDKNMTKMLLDGEIDAAIYGAELPADRRLKSIIADPDAAARQWHARHGVVPINHMVVATQSLLQSRPAQVVEFYRLLAAAKQAAGVPKPGAIDFHPFGVEQCRPALKLIINYALQQKLIPRGFAVDDLFDDTTRALGP